LVTQRKFNGLVLGIMILTNILEKHWNFQQDGPAGPAQGCTNAVLLRSSWWWGMGGYHVIHCTKGPDHVCFCWWHQDVNQTNWCWLTADCSFHFCWSRPSRSRDLPESWASPEAGRESWETWDLTQNVNWTSRKIDDFRFRSRICLKSKTYMEISTVKTQ